MVFCVFTAVWPKLFSKMNSSHGVWLLWLVLVQRFCPLGFSQKSLWVMCLGVCVCVCVCGVVFAVVGGHLCSASPIVLERFGGELPVVGVCSFFAAIPLISYDFL